MSKEVAMEQKKEKKVQKKKKESKEEPANKLDICKKAPEWAEHERLSDKDEPCDDFRGGSD